MQDFPANSHKAKVTEEPREKLEPVTSAKASGRKRGLGRQFKDTFFSGTAKDAAGYMMEDVVVPAIRDTVREALQAGIDRLIYGEHGRTPRRGNSSFWSANSGSVSYQPQTPYNRMSTSARQTPQQRTLSRPAQARHDFTELIIPSRLEAEEVIDRLFDILSRYGQVSVADLYELTDIRSSHTDMKWGWTNLRGAKPDRLRNGGFLLNLPEPEALG